MAGLRWRLIFLCLSYLAVDVIAKSEAGALEKIAQYLLYMIMYKYTTTADGKAPVGTPPPPKDRPLPVDPKSPNKKPPPPGNFWSRTDMPFLPQTKNGKNRGPKGVGVTSEMLSFPDFLDAVHGLPPYDSLRDGDVRKMDSARESGIEWKTDNFDELAHKIWTSGFGGEINLNAARGLYTRPFGDNYPRLILLLGDRLEYARKLNPSGLEDDLKLLRSMPQSIVDRRVSEFYRYLYRDIDAKFFTKRNAKGEAVDDKNKPIDESNQKLFDAKRIPIGHGAVAGYGQLRDPNDPSRIWNKIDVPKTLEHPDNREPLEKALGPPQGDYVHSGNNEAKKKRLADNWYRDKFRAWADNYGSTRLDVNIPPQPKQAVSHRAVIEAWLDVKAHLDKNTC